MKNLGLHKYALSLLKKYGVDRDAYKWTDEETMTYGDVLGNLDTHIAESLCALKDAAYGNKELDIDANENIRKDIFEHKKYSALDIVSEFYRIGNAVKPAKKDKYHLIWDTENCTDGFDCGNNKKALKNIMEDFLIEWKVQFHDQEDRSADAWDQMIYNCGCRCYRNADLTPDVDLDDIWSYGLSYEDEKEIGWETTERMDDATYASYAEIYGWPERKKN